VPSPRRRPQVSGGGVRTATKWLPVQSRRRQELPDQSENRFRLGVYDCRSTALLARLHLEMACSRRRWCPANGRHGTGCPTASRDEPEAYREKAVPFGELTSIDPNERFRLETGRDIEPRVIELLARSARASAA
jgi:hypothetical protein